MLRVLEDEFRVYPPYWYYRAKTAEEAGNDKETRESFKKFAEVWRPVLRKDTYKVEAEKYHVRKLAGDNQANHRDEIMKALDEIRSNTQKEDWANNLFAGVALFVMGDHEQDIECLDINVDFEYEQQISGAILAQMKKGDLNGYSAQEIVKSLQLVELQPMTTQNSEKKSSNTDVVSNNSSAGCEAGLGMTGLIILIATFNHKIFQSE